jgi:diamine N-acetyltransferase
MLEWLHNEDTTQYLRLNEKSTTSEDVARFIEEARDENTSCHRAIVDSEDHYLGTVSLKDINHTTKEAEYAIAMHPSAFGGGAARWATKAIFLLAFDQLQLERVYLNVLEENERAVRFYDRLINIGLKPYDKSRTDFCGAEKELLWYEIRATLFFESVHALTEDTEQHKCLPGEGVAHV